jgi:hypothetical protein
MPPRWQPDQSLTGFWRDRREAVFLFVQSPGHPGDVIEAACFCSCCAV